MLLLYPLEVVQASLLSSLFSFDEFELLVLGLLKKFVRLEHLSLLIQYYFFFFLKVFFLFLWWIWHLFQIFQSFGSFHLFYHLKRHMKLNGQKRLNEIEQRNSRKNQKFLALNGKLFFLLAYFYFQSIYYD